MPGANLGNKKLALGATLEFKKDAGAIIGSDRDRLEVFVAKYFVIEGTDFPLGPATGGCERSSDRQARLPLPGRW